VRFIGPDGGHATLDVEIKYDFPFNIMQKVRASGYRGFKSTSPLTYEWKVLARPPVAVDDPGPSKEAWQGALSVSCAATLYERLLTGTGGITAIGDQEIWVQAALAGMPCLLSLAHAGTGTSSGL